MLRSLIRYADGRMSHETTDAALRDAIVDPQCSFWLDMVKPTDEEYGLLDDVFGFHPLAIEDTIGYSQRPKIESYVHTGDRCRAGYFYMVFHGPDLETFRRRLRTKELDLFVSERYLITIHEEKMQSIEEVFSRAVVNPERALDRGMDLLLHDILDHLVDHYQPILDYLDEALDVLEEQALSNPQPELLNQIAIKKRELLNFRRIVGPQREVVAQLTRGEVPFIRESTRIYLRDVQDHLVRTVEMIELYRDLVTGARDIYLSSLSNRTNEIMKTLTIISVIALPITAITGFFGMNFEAIPGLHSLVGFWMSVCIMATAVIGLLFFFRHRGWLGGGGRQTPGFDIIVEKEAAGPPAGDPPAASGH